MAKEPTIGVGEGSGSGSGSVGGLVGSGLDGGSTGRVGTCGEGSGVFVGSGDGLWALMLVEGPVMPSTMAATETVTDDLSQTIHADVSVTVDILAPFREIA